MLGFLGPLLLRLLALTDIEIPIFRIALPTRAAQSCTRPKIGVGA